MNELGGLSISEEMAQTLSGLAALPEDAQALVHAASIQPEQFAMFLHEYGLEENPEARRLLEAAREVQSKDTTDSWNEQLLTSVLGDFQQDNPLGDESFGQWLSDLLMRVNGACGIDYSMMFVSPTPVVTRKVLPYLCEPLSCAGIPTTNWIRVKHLNWRKVDLPDPGRGLKADILPSDGITITTEEERDRLSNGIKGLPRADLDLARFLVPVYVSELYRGVMVFGWKQGHLAGSVDHSFLVRLGHRLLVSSIIRRAGFDATTIQKEWASSFTSLQDHYRGTLASMPDATYIVRRYLESQEAPLTGVDHVTALRAAQKIQKIAQEVSLRKYQPSHFLAQTEVLPKSGIKRSGTSTVKQLIQAGNHNATASEAQDQLLKNLLDCFAIDNPIDDDTLSSWLSDLLKRLNKVCGLSYTLVFVSPRPSLGMDLLSHLLQPIAASGIPDHVWTQVTHFNWGKAGMSEPGSWLEPLVMMSPGEAVTDGRTFTTVGRAIKGLPDELLNNAYLLVPVYLSYIYRGAILFGRPTTQTDFNHDNSFLARLAHRLVVSTLIRRAGNDLRSLPNDLFTVTESLQHEYITSLTRLSDTAPFLVNYLTGQSATIGYSRQLALKAATHIDTLCRRVSQRTRSLQVMTASPDMLRRLMRFNTYPLAELVQASTMAYTADLEAKNLRFIIEESISDLRPLELDRHAFLNAFGLLLENAVKYAHRNTFIKVAGTRVNGKVVLSIENFGQGIESDDSRKIYSARYQGRRSERALREPGRGLGLFVADQLVQAMGGKIWHHVASGTRYSYSKTLEGYWVQFNVELPQSQKESSRV